MRFALVAGEASGDLLAAGLIRVLKVRIPDAEFEGVAGPAMVAAGCTQLEDAETLAVMGLVEPLKVLPKLLRLRRGLVERWTRKPPDVFIGIDSPDFNLGLEEQLRAHGVRTAHYVSPQVWAWRRGRIKKIRRACDCVLCILPFEKPFYDEHGVPAEFVGHPKADKSPDHVDMAAARTALGLRGDADVVALLPGSRSSEVSRLGGVFAFAASRIRDRYPDVRFVTPVARPRLKPLIEAQLDAAGIRDSVLLLDGNAEGAMSAADVVLLASGTAALESALLEKPTVAAYKLAPLTAVIIRLFGLLKIERVTMPNLLTETPLIPEFLQSDATPEALAGAVVDLLGDPDRRRAIADRFAKLRSELAQNADERAADAVLGLANHAPTKAV